MGGLLLPRVHAQREAADEDSSDARALDPPRLVDPPPSAVLDTGVDYPPSTATWFFSWTSVERATRYHLVVSAPGDVVPSIAIVIDASGGTCFSHYPQCHARVTLARRMDDATRVGWRWRVRGGTQGSWGPWSETRSFDVAARDGAGGSPVEVTGTIDGWPYGAARAHGYWDPTMPPVVEGRITGDGVLTAILPPLVLGDSLLTFGRSSPSGILQIGDARGVVIGLWALSDDDGVGRGVLTMSTTDGRRLLESPADARRGDAVAVWWFSDADVTVRGSDVRSGAELAYVLDLVVGWNLVLLRVVSEAADASVQLVEVTTIDALPEDVAWRWAPGSR